MGACVGMRGSRVKNIVRELNNEKVDIIRWSADPKEFVLEALKPAKIKSVDLDPEKKSVQIRWTRTSSRWPSASAARMRG